jgi:hypothetical protein
MPTGCPCSCSTQPGCASASSRRSPGVTSTSGAGAGASGRLSQDRRPAGCHRRRSSSRRSQRSFRATIALLSGRCSAASAPTASAPLSRAAVRAQVCRRSAARPPAPPSQSPARTGALVGQDWGVRRAWRSRHDGPDVHARSRRREGARLLTTARLRPEWDTCALAHDGRSSLSTAAEMRRER